jgi:hypothetical protein
MPTALENALASSAPRIGIFFRLSVDPIVRLWLGVGNCDAGIDVADGAGATYSGLGEMVNLPSLTQLVNGAADRVEFHLSGVSRRVLQLASSESDEVKGAALLVGIGVFAADWQLITAPTWLRRFTVDYLSVQFENPSDGTPVRTITLSARTMLTGRRRPGLSYFTDRDQQAKSPGDAFCERSVLYSQDATKTWPRF